MDLNLIHLKHVPNTVPENHKLSMLTISQEEILLEPTVLLLMLMALMVLMEVDPELSMTKLISQNIISALFLISRHLFLTLIKVCSQSKVKQVVTIDTFVLNLVDHMLEFGQELVGMLMIQISLMANGIT